MNPALGLLLALALVAAWAWRTSPHGSERRAMAGAAFALVAASIWFFRAPLLLRTGLASPSAAAAAVAPWQGLAPTGAAGGGNPQLRDVTFQIEPWLLFSRRELRAGALPFWNPHQFGGAPFWANGQAAPIFPLHLLSAALPVQLGLMLLPWCRLLLASSGVWLLARALGRTPLASLAAAITFGLSGMLVSFQLFPMGNALALVPWVFLATERLVQRRGAIWELAAASGLQLLAGHPETAAHTALLSGLYLLMRSGREVATWWLGGRWLGAWVLGATTAAAQIVPFTVLLPETVRWPQVGAPAGPPFLLLAELPLRLVLPEMYGHPALGTWRGPFNYSATAVYVGALALPLCAAGLAVCGRRRDGRRPWLAMLVVTAFSFCAAYHWPGVREALGVLPVIGRALPHRLLFGVELGLSLFLAAGVDEIAAGRARGALAGSAAALAMLGAAWATQRAAWSESGLLPRQEIGSALVVVGALFVLTLARLPVAARRRLLWTVPALSTLDLSWTHGRIFGALSAEQLLPRTPAIEFLATAGARLAAVDSVLRPNAAMAYGLDDVRGDDPTKLEVYERSFAPLAAPVRTAGQRVEFRPIQHWQDPWLDRMGVRWVVTGPQEPPRHDWRLAYEGSDARVFERATAHQIEGSRRRAGWTLALGADPPPRLRIAETWAPGWRALLGRSPGSPESLAPAADGAGMELAVPVGEQRIEALYRPLGSSVGFAASALGVAMLAALAAPAAALRIGR